LESSKEDKWLKEMKPKNCSTDSERQASLLMTKDINTKWFMIIEQAKNDRLGLHKFTRFVWNDEARSCKKGEIKFNEFAQLVSQLFKIKVEETFSF